MTRDIIYDVAVIGGGPAGMVAAIRAAELGASVVLIEKNEKLGKKLLITGGGRCNVTNATFDNRALAQKYGKKGKFLLSPFSKWSAQNTIDFFESHGMPTNVESENRAFPMSNRAQSVWDVLVQQLKKYKVTILTKASVQKILHTKNIITGVSVSITLPSLISSGLKGTSCTSISNHYAQETKVAPHGTIRAHSYIITTGGTARPETGSTGDGFKWLKALGHTIVAPDSALVPVKIAESWVKKLQGLSLTNVKITLLENGLSRDAKIGKILFTHFGISGPLVLNMSYTIAEALNESLVMLALDLFPSLDHTALDVKLRLHLEKHQNRKWQNALVGFVPPLLAAVLVELSKIDPELIVNKVPRALRLAFVKTMKNLLLTPTGLLGTEKAIVSSGGIALEEVDFKTMRSRKIDNLYLAGDVLDFDRPSGGFSLQICWTTGFVAAGGAVSKK